MSDPHDIFREDMTEEADKTAQARLREANKNEFTCELSVIGDTWAATYNTFMCEGFNPQAFNRKYIATQVKHNWDGGSGYATSISGRGVLEGY